MTDGLLPFFFLSAPSSYITHFNIFMAERKIDKTRDCMLFQQWRHTVFNFRTSLAK